MAKRVNKNKASETAKKTIEHETIETLIKKAKNRDYKSAVKLLFRMPNYFQKNEEGELLLDYFKSCLGKLDFIKFMNKGGKKGRKGINARLSKELFEAFNLKSFKGCPKNINGMRKDFKSAKIKSKIFIRYCELERKGIFYNKTKSKTKKLIESQLENEFGKECYANIYRDIIGEAKEGYVAKNQKSFFIYLITIMSHFLNNVPNDCKKCNEKYKKTKKHISNFKNYANNLINNADEKEFINEMIKETKKCLDNIKDIICIVAVDYIENIYYELLRIDAINKDKSK